MIGKSISLEATITTTDQSQKWLSMSKSIGSQLSAVVQEDEEDDDDDDDDDAESCGHNLPLLFLVVRFYAVDPCKLAGVERWVERRIFREKVSKQSFILPFTTTTPLFPHSPPLLHLLFITTNPPLLSPIHYH